MVKEIVTGALFSTPIVGPTGIISCPTLILASWSKETLGKTLNHLHTVPHLPRFPQGAFPEKNKGFRGRSIGMSKKTNACRVISVSSLCEAVMYRMASSAQGNVYLMLTSTSPRGKLFHIIHWYSTSAKFRPVNPGFAIVECSKQLLLVLCLFSEWWQWRAGECCTGVKAVSHKEKKWVEV